jgi:hypothetical protein
VWKTRYDMTISVGLGTGNREQQMNNLMAVMNVQKEAFQAGVVTPENIYNSATKLAEIAGFKSPEQFFTNAQPKQQGIPPEIQEQIQKQAQAMQEAIQKLQQENQQLQGEILKRDTDSSVEVFKINKASETELTKTQMLNESKEMIAKMEAMLDAFNQNQTAMTDRVGAMEEKEPDLSPLV